MNTKLTTVPTAKAVGDRRYRFKLSDGSLDRDGDMIDPHGWDVSEYVKNPVVLWSHDMKIPAIGRCPHIGVEKDALVGDVMFPPEGIFPFADTVRGLVEAGILTTSSVGFRPIRGTPTSKGTHYHEQALVEWSIVNVPSNPSASLQGLSPKDAHHLAVVKNFLQISDGRLTRLEPHTRGLDPLRLKTWLGQKSDLHPSAFCPQGPRCPSKGPQLAICPAGTTCPLGRGGPKETVVEDKLFDAADLPMIRDAALAELRRQVPALTRGVIAEALGPMLRQHYTMTTGKID